MLLIAQASSIIDFFLKVTNMSGTQATWSADGSYIPSIELHTKAKHQILEEYIENLIITLYGKPRYGETTFTFVDGFCGGGMYEDKDNKTQWEGSPLRIIKAVREGFIKSKRRLNLHVKYIFIDHNNNHLNCLKNYSMLTAGLEKLSNEKADNFNSDFATLVEQCEFITSKFENTVEHCYRTASNRKGHSFFLLDPFGWTDVSMASIKVINSLRGRLKSSKQVIIITRGV